ncbi:G2/mitotic-specific cyclin S13-7-like isoform X2 [Impatiens glandulifera]|uniref:G2/mitotic-specific cyclin S13-7-like isoform X2 n=1 Tax=Impatiens glandulifera TaxID=253017 RepID=UPI001FB0ECA1|nr:G2/mitotic-specific cyclin S13-7-like isoform X2 [Impatiens glandulifera]
MASRQIVQQQNRGVAAPAAADGKNRRALGDIGNVVTYYGVDPKKISRPITSFCAQLLANAQAQAAAVATDNKKVAAVGAVKPAAAPHAQKKAAVPKPKRPTETEIIIIPDTDKKAMKEASSTKVAKAFTSILSARSKAACGLNNNNEKKNNIINVDAGDEENELAVVEYIEDIYKFYKIVEKENRVQDYIDLQPEINEKMRAVLVDWLVEVHQKFELTMETLYLTINIIDRYLSSKVTQRKELQLVGIGAMLMASKYEEIWAPEVNDFVCIADNAYTHKQVLVTEKRILERLEWNLTVATPYVFLVRFIKASGSDQDVENMAYFLAEMGIVNYSTVMFNPSLMAAAAVYVAQCTVVKKKKNGGAIWDETLKVHTGFMECDLMECAKLLVGFHSNAGQHKLKAVYRKYSSLEKGAVALLPPAVLGTSYISF